MLPFIRSFMYFFSYLFLDKNPFPEKIIGVIFFNRKKKPKKCINFFKCCTRNLKLLAYFSTLIIFQLSKLQRLARDAHIKEWSRGKKGNLCMLLSTLQLVCIRPHFFFLCTLCFAKNILF